MTRTDAAPPDTDADAVPALGAGATGYLLKDTPREELRRAAAVARAFERGLLGSNRT